jgi:hypothetical protein
MNTAIIVVVCIVLGVVALFELPKLYFMRDPNGQYTVAPLAITDTPTISQSTIPWLRGHLLVAAAFIVCVCWGLVDSDQLTNITYQIFLGALMVLFVAQIAYNPNKLGQLPPKIATAINTIACLAIASSILVCIFSLDDDTKYTALLVAFSILASVPMLINIYTIITWIVAGINKCRTMVN